jgi:hypothetical protein
MDIHRLDPRDISPQAHEALIADLVLYDWYVAHDPEIAARALSAVVHYRDRGWREGRSPNPYFDPAFYRAARGATLAEGAAAEVPEGDPLLDYLLCGEAAGIRPSPHFDPVWYKAVYGLGTADSALAHFLRRRLSGTVSPNPHFDAGFYLAKYPDIRAAGLDPFLHYLNSGRAELRLPREERSLIAESGIFDEAYYLFTYEDVRLAGIDALDHFLAQREGRKPCLYFDTGWYCARHGVDTAINAVTHYLQIGEERGFAPGPYFDPVWYRQRYALPEDVSPLRHYLNHRTTQLYAPNPAFDVAAYVRRAGARLRPGRDPFIHHLVLKPAKPRRRGGGKSRSKSRTSSPN